MVNSGSYKVARLQGMNGADPFNATWNLMAHVIGIEILHEHSVVPETHLENLWIMSSISVMSESSNTTMDLPRDYERLTLLAY